MPTSEPIVVDVSAELAEELRKGITLQGCVVLKLDDDKRVLTITATKDHRV